jgi:putative oxygen-independent coproporphyrinogen III oxidase
VTVDLAGVLVEPAAPTHAPPGATAAPPAGLYVHVPFCVSHCPYCDFVVVAGREARGPGNRIDVFVLALERELALRADELDARWGARPALQSVYLGGGTPSLLPAATIARLLELIAARFGIAPHAEITVEANPGADERGDARGLRAAGVTRLSIGAQSLDAGELRRLGRRHAPEDVAATVREAREVGIGSISLDLLYDIPRGSLAMWARTLETAISMEPDHLSLYALTLDDPDAEGMTGATGDHLPVRPGARRWRDRARTEQDDDLAAAMYTHADARLSAAGFEWYEISNWARPGHRSRHNLGYWQGRPWEAVGPGAHAFDGTTRRWNAAPLASYLAALLPPRGTAPSLPPGGREPDEPGARVRETAILALRTSAGLPAATLDDAELGAPLRWARENGLLGASADGRLILTLRGRMLSSELFVRLI